MLLLDVITIGDGMIAMDPCSKGPLRFSNTFERKIGGAELNFAIGCSRLGLKAGWISRLGKDEFGRHILFSARGEGVDTAEVKLVEGYPTSVYFREVLADGSGRSFYYRDNSPTSTLTKEDLKEEYFSSAKLLHLSGVFPSINDNNRELVKHAVQLAKKNGLVVAFDPNIRLKMWTKDEAKAFITELLPNVDILLTGEEESEILLGQDKLENYISKFHDYGISNVVIKRGDRGAIGSDGKKTYVAQPMKPRAVVDTVGAGDGFDAGFISSILKGSSFEKALHFANAVGALVVSVSGDNEGLPYFEDVQTFLGEIECIER